MKTLFGDATLPDGFRLEDDFLTPAEESDLVERFGAMEFHELRMRGVTARRRNL